MVALKRCWIYGESFEVMLKKQLMARPFAEMGIINQRNMVMGVWLRFPMDAMFLKLWVIGAILQNCVVKKPYL